MLGSNLSTIAGHTAEGGSSLPPYSSAGGYKAKNPGLGSKRQRPYKTEIIEKLPFRCAEIPRPELSKNLI